MDHQSLALRRWRISGKLFQHVPPEDSIPLLERWLNPRTANCGKIDLDEIRVKVLSDEWDLWRLLAPARGIAVTYPEEGQLFIHYLRGKGLFGTVNKETLLSAARDEGLKGMSAEVRSDAHARLLGSVGFKVAECSPLGVWKMELTDGR